ncbi:Uma2 family endonuclease [Rhodoflexus sp.]
METVTYKLSPEEEAYLAKEAQAEHKSEYRAGEIVAMAGAQEPHNLIVGNLIGELYFCLKHKNCRIYPSDMLIHVPDYERYLYADVTVVCDTVKLAEERRKGIDVLLNPNIVIEVLSQRTAVYDMTEKFECYKTIPDVRQYVLVDSERVSVDTFTRTPEDDWLLKSAKEITKTIKIGECVIALEDIYNKVVFAPKLTTD